MQLLNAQPVLFSVKPLLLCFAATTFLLTGCGDAETNIAEKASIPADTDDHDHDHGAPISEAAGRLLVMNPAAIEAQVFNLKDNSSLNVIALDTLPSAVYATGGYRYATLIERNADKVSFVDGGLWLQAHDDHFDLMSSLPVLTNTTIAGSKPTHYDAFEGQSALFFDGDGATGTNASVQVFDNAAIAEGKAPKTIALSMPMHGVAKTRGEHLLTTLRRDDSTSTSGNKILPDQVGVYHQHDGDYELEQTLETTCANLHGAAQNDMHVVFGCSDGVLLATENADDTYSSAKIPNASTLQEDARIGSLWGHEDTGKFIGAASAGEANQFFEIDPQQAQMTLIDWQPVANAKPIARGFAYKAEQFVILDDQGYLTVIEPHEEENSLHWEFGERLAITEADVSLMPEGMQFSMAFAQDGHTVYIGDPIAQHIIVVDLEMLNITGEIELGYAPAMLTWLGIAKDQGDKDHQEGEHNH